MSDDPSDGGHVDVSGYFRRDHLREGEYTFLFVIPDDIAVLMGRITSLWGVYELRMDALLEHVIALIQYKAPKGWKKSGFERKKKLFRNVMSEYTSRHAPSERVVFEKISDEADKYQDRRNVIVHGHVVIKADPGDKNKIIFLAISDYEGRQPVPLTVDNLNDIYHGIAHMVGNMMASVNRMGGWVENSDLELVISDSEIINGPEFGPLRFLRFSR